MMTTTTGAAQKVTGGAAGGKAAEVSKAAGDVHVHKDKEKVEKRRALGRGLESLLPGPRVVPAASSAQPDAGVAVSSPGGTPLQGSGTADGRGVPHFVRDDNSKTPGKIARGQAVVEGVAGDVASNVSTESGGLGVAATAVAIGEEPRAGGPSTAAQGGSARYAETRAGAPAPHESESHIAAPHEPQSEVIPEIHAQAGQVPSNIVAQLPLDHIEKNPYQTRYLFDQDLLEELADSIKANGVVQPVVVRPAEEEGRYVLILGERRCRASKMAGKTTVPAIVRRVSPQQAAEMTIVENLQRQDLNALEQAEAFRFLSKEFNLSQAEIGARVGMSRESISNYMRLLRLPEQVLHYLAVGKIRFSEAREILRLEDDSKIPDLVNHIIAKHMSIEQIETMVGRMNGWLDPVPGMPGQEKKKGGSRWVDPNVRAAQLEMERILGVRVRIRDRKGKGKIVIEYATVDDYQRVVEMLRGKKK